jgi:hypothetical protein
VMLPLRRLESAESSDATTLLVLPGSLTGFRYLGVRGAK